MDTRPDYDSSMRMVAHDVARDLSEVLSGKPLPDPMGLNSFFRTHSHFRSHGWYGDPSMRRLKETCERVFVDEPEDREAFVRGLRSAAMIRRDDLTDTPGTIDDRDVFWKCVEALGRETGTEMPRRPPERSGPRMRGH